MVSLNDLKRKFIRYYINSRGWRTDRKLVVIESDDWGSIRMPSKEVYELLSAKGLPVDKLPYLKYDSLESNSDLEALFDVLTGFRDKNGNHPVITANTIMTNPDFEKIRASGFSEYHYEIFTETLKRYPAHNRVLDLYKEGIAEKVFCPQLHGFEHLNVPRWMQALQNANNNARLAFDNRIFDLGTSHTIISEDSFVDALCPNDKEELEDQKKKLSLAAKIFNDLFGYKSMTFIAPCFAWRPEFEKALALSDVRCIQSGFYQLVPTYGKINNFKKRLHFTGQKNKYGLIYTIRNCNFEPSSNQTIDPVRTCLEQMNTAFINQKPAIIGSHRLNFISSIVNENGSRNLVMLKRLFNEMLIKWPDIEFITSADLCRIINPNLESYGI